jgi:GNAT superfamily N-acetyltransferase
VTAPAIRRAEVADAPAISALIAGLAHHFTLHPDGRGAERFFAGVTPEAIAGCIGDPTIDYRVAEAEGVLVGAASLRDGAHLYHLFVAGTHHGHGLGRRLWETLRDAAPDPRGAFTVNASPNALPVYAAFGFAPTGARSEANGIAYVPMRLAPRS